MREIVLDIETTGLDPREGHRVVEIGAVELEGHIPTGQTFQAYINPERDMPKEAEAVHGISAKFLEDKPVFSAVVADFLDFIGESTLIIHNAPFDTGFLNFQLKEMGLAPLAPARVLDTLMLARKKHLMGPNSLDALCRRYKIDLSKRKHHGALLDSLLLADVYLELVGGRQVGLQLGSTERTRTLPSAATSGPVRRQSRETSLPGFLTEEELRAHTDLVAGLEAPALWDREP